ncbi:hypothetical protein Tco_0502404 [Tanacetum coccineum]
MLPNDLIDQKLHTYAERQNNNKRKADDSSRNNQQPHKKQNVARAYTAGPGEKKAYTGNLPLCTKCNYHHTGQYCHGIRRMPKLKYVGMERKIDVKEELMLGGKDASMDSNIITGTFHSQTPCSHGRVHLVEEKILRVQFRREMLIFQAMENQQGRIPTKYLFDALKHKSLCQRDVHAVLAHSDYHEGNQRQVEGESDLRSYRLSEELS